MKISKKISIGVLCFAVLVMLAACSGQNYKADFNGPVAEEGATSFADSIKKLTNEKDKGSFVIKDGIETYMEQGQVIKDKLVKVDGRLYYVDANGHKVKDQWAVIDNDGNYGYFGSLGELVINKIRYINGKEYYFDENGILYQDRTEKKIKVIDGVEYVANRNGELRLATDETFASATTVAPTTNAQQATTVSAAQAAAQQAAAQQAAAQQAAAQQAAAQQAAAQAAAQQSVSTNPPFSNAININQGSGTAVPNEYGGPGVINNTGNYNYQTVAPTTAATNNAMVANEVKVTRTEKIIDSIDGDDYECKITLLKPIMVGTSEEETMNMNAAIDEITDTWMELVMAVAQGYSTLPKSVTFTSVDLGTVNKTKVIINISGNIRPKSGSSKTIKYRITYFREDAYAEVAKTSN